MERSNTCSKLKQGSMSYKLKGSSWDLRNDSVGNCSYWKEADLAAAGFSWPPRSYTCTFCKREFRSAQALGGHMNVHRRDRARLRLSPSLGGNKTLNLDLNPTTLNPNPNSSTPPNLSSLFTKFPQFSSALPPICPYNSMTRLSSKGSFSVERFGSSGVDDRVFKKGEQLVRLDLEIGLITQSEELDLELRLGYT